jgi:predicted DCC family thiol-disulfide oxidoreductase YuxK
MIASGRPVLLYDGECGLCNALVRFVLKHDQRGVLLFSALQGKTGQAFLKNRCLDTRDFDSLVFIEDVQRVDAAFYRRTSGALRAMAEMGGGWRKLARMLAIVPTSWGDVIYNVVARTRYRMFGRYRPTPLPDVKWAARIID